MYRAEARYTICSGQTHFRDVFIEDMRFTFRLMRTLLPPTPTPPKKLFEFVQISRPTLAEVGWARAHPWHRSQNFGIGLERSATALSIWSCLTSLAMSRPNLKSLFVSLRQIRDKYAFKGQLKWY